MENNEFEIIKIEKIDEKILVDTNDGYLETLKFIVFYKSKKEPDCILFKYVSSYDFACNVNYIYFYPFDTEIREDATALITETEFDYDSMLKRMIDSGQHEYSEIGTDIKTDHSKEYLDRILLKVGWNVKKTE